MAKGRAQAKPYSMANWLHPPQLVELDRFYQLEAANPEQFADDQVLSKIEGTFWGTNCWSYVEAAFAIIAPACLRRPHLTKRLIAHPIRAMIYGGLEAPEDVVDQGVAFAYKDDPYIRPSPEGLKWLLEVWPSCDGLAQDVFREIWLECSEPSSAPAT